MRKARQKKEHKESTPTPVEGDKPTEEHPQPPPTPVHEEGITQTPPK